MFSIFSVDDLSNHLIEDMMHFDFAQKELISALAFLFFHEPSTRTKESFRLAFDNFKIPCIDMNFEMSSIKKGEGLKQTLQTVCNYKQKTICVWRGNNLMPKIHLPNVAMINAGDGINEHPTQALGDLLTIQQALGKKFTSNFLQGVNVAIVGDIENSRVARSNIKILKRFGAKITLVSTANLLSKNLANYYKEDFGCKITHELTPEILQNNQFLMFLRMQSERANARDLAVEKTTLTEKNLHFLHKNSFIMHPGPVNIGVELCREAFEGNQSLIGKQVENAFLARKFLIHKILDR